MKIALGIGVHLSSCSVCPPWTSTPDSCSMRQDEDFRLEPLSQSAFSLASLGSLSLYLLLLPPGFLLPWLKIRIEVK